MIAPPPGLFTAFFAFFAALVGAAFSFKDHIVKIVRGGPAPAEKRLFSGNKFSVEPGPRTGIMKGYDLRPYGIVYSSSEPKWALDGMSAPEVQDCVLFVGKIGGPQFSIVVVIQRPGMITRTIKVALAAIGEGADWTADEGAGATGKLGGPAQDILIAKGSNPLQSIFAHGPR